MTQRARSWLFGVALLAAGVGLGSVAPRWFAKVEDVRRRPDVITQVRELSR
ncbi:MAG: hypothetical protein RL033_7942, partial [Pseudomonadota bacterium]